MPRYFAYGANLDRVGMAERCPRSQPLGPGRLGRHRFRIMADGYATVVPDPSSDVHGLLWEIASEDVHALDAFEELDTGLYRRGSIQVHWEGRLIEAEIYRATSAVAGTPRPGYMELIVAAAEGCGFPQPYLAELRGWLASKAPQIL